ncbi:hypothetical protein NRIC_31130 [Enterococcus florum]|uniref:Aminoglycoside phosphotransferase domain-containing protein n=1 Tax=Enterococcus florum TaxID=2480627 RepID=A0A4P5PHU9_9ENTE|nr:phosphotransferase [Enterococcus florum]GCF95222.1 hypothetical protein NRIC_31130 [Enterococcus florum]
MDISVETLHDYLIEKTDLFTPEEPIDILQLTNENDSYIEGYVNYLFKVRQHGRSYIVKHAKAFISSAIDLGELDPSRNYLEYMTYRLRKGLSPEAVPEVVFVDEDHHLFIMEDLSQLSVLRFFLCKGKKAPLLGKQIGEFLANCHFHTSAFNLDEQKQKDLAYYFENSDMRRVIVDFILQPHESMIAEANNYEIALQSILFSFKEQPALWEDWQQLIRDFSRHSQCLIHGDFHSSNIFISPSQLKVIDMEYTMMGPFSYDLGYFLANLVSQYACYSVRSLPSNVKRENMTAYLLSMIENVYQSYFSKFEECYRVNKGKRQNLEALFLQIFQDSLGYLAIANITRTANNGTFPDFDVIQTKSEHFIAKALSLKLAESLLKNRKRLISPSDMTHLLTKEGKRFMADIEALNHQPSKLLQK